MAAILAIAENNGVRLYTIDDVLMDYEKTYGPETTETKAARDVLGGYDTLQEYFEDEVNNPKTAGSRILFAACVEFCFDFSNLKYSL
jgi:hypothetical protein